jgi:hypothetical protein
VPQRLQHQIRTRRARGRATDKGIFGTMAEAGAAAYLRPRDLPKLIALWPQELDDESPEGTFRVLAKLRRALRPSGDAVSRAIGAMTSIGISAC